LAAGQYSIAALPPPSRAALLRNEIGPFVVSAGASYAGKNIELTAPLPPPPGTTITHRALTEAGLPIVYLAEPLHLSTNGCEGGKATYRVFDAGGTIEASALLETVAGRYEATVGPLQPAHGDARVEIAIECPVPSESETITFDIYIDPS